MNIIAKNCQKYIYKFPEPSSLREAFFAPSMVVRKDGTIAERIQRWLIDNGDFYTTTRKSLTHYVGDNRQAKPLIFDETKLFKGLDRIFLLESVAGHSFYLVMTSMILRSIELFSQSTKNSINFSALSPSAKTIANLLVIPAVIAVTLSLGHYWEDLIIFAFLPILLEKALSFKWSNYFKQIHMLSSTKDFVLKDFVFKNIQFTLLRILSVILIILYKPQLLNDGEYPASMILCKHSGQWSEDFEIPHFNRASSSNIELLLIEPLLLVLGKMTFDLTYILMLKTFDKDADLRDPMGWMFSKFRHQATPTVPSQARETFSQKSTKKSNFNREVTTSNQNETQPDEASVLKPIEFNESTNCTPEKAKEASKKNKTKPSQKINTQPLAQKTIIPTETLTDINIEVGGWVRSFQKIEDSSFKKETWAVIIADSVEKQKLAKYERLLSNGIIGGSIRQLKGWGDRYEIGTTMDSRLIGKMYDSGIYNSLQNFMRLEDALQVSQELERNSIPDNVSLIVFSDEAKTHKDISRVASKL